MNNRIDEYYSCVSDLTQLDEIQRLDGFTQHLNTSRLEHCVNVSYYSYCICKKFGWDYRSAARAGLLHDFYLYDRHEEKESPKHHISAHAKIALNNSQKITSLNKIEADAIVKHMWPMTMRFPKYKESYVVNLVDTFCAAYEFVKQTKRRAMEYLQPSTV